MTNTDDLPPHPHEFDRDYVLHKLKAQVVAAIELSIQHLNLAPLPLAPDTPTSIYEESFEDVQALLTLANFIINNPRKRDYSVDFGKYTADILDKIKGRIHPHHD